VRLHAGAVKTVREHGGATGSIPKTVQRCASGVWFKYVHGRRKEALEETRDERIRKSGEMGGRAERAWADVVVCPVLGGVNDWSHG
jgi:hypothetical protein